jgi:hypothetical protein
MHLLASKSLLVNPIKRVAFVIENFSLVEPQGNFFLRVLYTVASMANVSSNFDATTQKEIVIC